MAASDRILIVGGGIGGLCAGIALEQAGLEFVVLERQAKIEEVGAGLCLWHNAMHVMAHFGLQDALLEVGAPLERQENRSSQGHVLASHSFESLNEAMGVGAVTVHRAALQDVLAASLPSAHVRLGHPCTGVTDGSDHVIAHLQDGGQEQGTALVGADGIRSVVRETLHGRRTPRYAGYTCRRGIVEAQPDWVPLGWFIQWLGHEARFGACHTGNGRMYWWATYNANEGDDAESGAVQQDLLDRYGDWARPVPEIIEATDSAVILCNDIIDRPPTREWGAGRVTLLGDAAHPMTPNMAQGACQAVEDAVVLADALSRADDVSSGLRAYEARRVQRTSLMVEQSWLIGARGHGLLTPEEERQAMQLADRELILNHKAV